MSKTLKDSLEEEREREMKMKMKKTESESERETLKTKAFISWMLHL